MSVNTILALSLSRYLKFYQDYAADKWDNLSPMEYGILLIMVGVFGWMLMKNASKR